MSEGANIYPLYREDGAKCNFFRVHEDRVDVVHFKRSDDGKTVTVGYQCLYPQVRVKGDYTAELMYELLAEKGYLVSSEKRFNYALDKVKGVIESSLVV